VRGAGRGTSVSQMRRSGSKYCTASVTPVISSPPAAYTFPPWAATARSQRRPASEAVGVPASHKRPDPRAARFTGSHCWVRGS
jgi:hypothetical protein